MGAAFGFSLMFIVEQKFYIKIVFSLSILDNQDHCIKRSVLQQQLLV